MEKETCRVWEQGDNVKGNVHDAMSTRSTSYFRSNERIRAWIVREPKKKGDVTVFFGYAGFTIQALSPCDLLLSSGLSTTATEWQNESWNPQQGCIPPTLTSITLPTLQVWQTCTLHSGLSMSGSRLLSGSYFWGSGRP